MLLAAGVQSGFNVRDLSRPDPARVRRYLSAIINFHKFRELQLQSFVEFSDRSVCGSAGLCSATTAKLMTTPA